MNDADATEITFEDQRLIHQVAGQQDEHLKTLDRYTTLAAEELRARGSRAGVMRLLFSPPATFLKSYLLKQGFRDGYQGFLIAAMAAWYVFLKYAKTR